MVVFGSVLDKAGRQRFHQIPGRHADLAVDFRCDIPRPTATRILRVVRDQGLLRDIRPASGRRAAVVAFVELLNIAEGRNAF